MTGDNEEGVARLAGGLVVDELGNGAVFFSLIVVVGALITGNPPFMSLGLVVGLIGILVAWRGMLRKWADSTMALMAVGVLVADVATLWVLWQRA